MIDEMKYPAWPFYSDDEIAAVNKVLRSGKVNYWTGDEGRQFEKEFANTMGCQHGIALANGTLALELALYALNIEAGDEVIVPSTTYFATASCVVMRGAKPVVVEVDPDSQNVTAETITSAITAKTKAIIVVHLSGWPCDMDPILELAKKHQLKVIEDCAQAAGAKYKGKYVGSFGDAAAFSFCQDKIISTLGEGGMLLLNDEKLWKKAWSYKDHGKDYDRVRQYHPLGFRWLHTDFGSNWRMTEAQAAIGRIQLKKMSHWVEGRRKNSTLLNHAFSKIPKLRTTIPGKDFYHAYYKYYVFVRQEQLNKGWTREMIIEQINARGIPCFTGGCPEIYLEDAFVKAGLSPDKRFPIAKQLGETSIVLLVHPTCDANTMRRVAEVVTEVMEEAMKETVV